MWKERGCMMGNPSKSINSSSHAFYFLFLVVVHFLFCFSRIFRVLLLRHANLINLGFS